MKKKIVIIGAGLAGLSCAYHLKRDYEHYEKEDRAGGLCRSTAVGGFTFDFAGHLLHFKTHDGFSLVRRLLGHSIAEHERHSYVFIKNRFSPYPFQANTYRLPRTVTKECLAGLVNNGNHSKPPGNFYEWMMHNFGQGTVEHFMLPYNRKFWRCHPRHLTCEWLDGKVPVPSLVDSIAGAFTHSTKAWGYNAHFWYPQKGGIATLVQAFEKQILPISFKHKLAKIDIGKRRLTFSNGFQTEYDRLVLTIPLPELLSVIRPLPEAVKSALRRLNYLSILNHNVGINRQCLRQKHWVYFPEDTFTFYRIGSFSSFCHNAAPVGQSALYIEASIRKYQDGGADERLVDRIENDLLRLGIVSAKKDIVARNTNHIKYGYVVYDRHYVQARKTIMGFLKKNNIVPIGRFGSWRYLSMEESMIDGKKAAEYFK